MQITVKVKPNARQEKVEVLNDTEYVVWVRQIAKEGKANEALIRVLSEYFDVAKSRITILKGFNQKNKLIFVDLK